MELAFPPEFFYSHITYLEKNNFYIRILLYITNDYTVVCMVCEQKSHIYTEIHPLYNGYITQAFTNILLL